jgi:GNAT superfamily N-acetyltransferase
LVRGITSRKARVREEQTNTLRFDRVSQSHKEVAPTPISSDTYTVKRLEAATWDAFAELVERNNGIYGGCWCAPNHVEYQRGVSDPRTLKEELVRTGRAQAALVFDRNGMAQGWCQYGGSEELDLKHGREYRKDPPPPARWRIACIFVDQRHRRQGVARAALEGALAEISAAGGGLVEAISETTAGREAQARFLFSGTVELFDELAFTRVRQVGKHAWIVNRMIEPEST